jgi:hypothetical protein
MEGEIGQAISISKKMGPALASLQNILEGTYEEYKESADVAQTEIWELIQALRTFDKPRTEEGLLYAMDLISLLFTYIFFGIMMCVFGAYLFCVWRETKRSQDETGEN